MCPFGVLCVCVRERERGECVIIDEGLIGKGSVRERHCVLIFFCICISSRFVSALVHELFCLPQIGPAVHFLEVLDRVVIAGSLYSPQLVAWEWQSTKLISFRNNHPLRLILVIGCFFVTCSADEINIWHPWFAEPMHSIQNNYTSQVTSLSAVSSSVFLATSLNGRVVTWSAQTGDMLHLVTAPHPSPVFSSLNWTQSKFEGLGGSCYVVGTEDGIRTFPAVVIAFPYSLFLSTFVFRKSSIIKAKVMFCHCVSGITPCHVQFSGDFRRYAGTHGCSRST